MTVQDLQQQLEQLKGSALAPGELDEGLQALQQQGWQGGDIPDGMAQPIIGAAQQRFAPKPQELEKPPVDLYNYGGGDWGYKPPEPPPGDPGSTVSKPLPGPIGPPEIQKSAPNQIAPNATPTTEPGPTYAPPSPPPTSPEQFQFQPWTEKYEAPKQIDPFAYDTWTKRYQSPDGLTDSNDPGWKQRMKLGTDAIQRGAAARGTLLSGGTLKSLMDYGQTFASNEYGAVDARARANYQQELGDYQTNRSNAFQEWSTKAGLNEQDRAQAWATYQNAQGQHNTEFGQQFSQDQLAQQGDIARGQLGLGYSQLNENARQANQGNAFNYSNLGEQGRQADNNLGYNVWNSGNQNRYNFASLMQNNNQFNANLGYQYAGLGENGRQFDANQQYNYWQGGNQNNQFYSGLNANTNFNYAQLMARIYGEGAANFNDSIYGGANARAGGQASSGNAWGNLATNAGDWLSRYYGSGGGGYRA